MCFFSFTCFYLFFQVFSRIPIIVLLLWITLYYYLWRISQFFLDAYTVCAFMIRAYIQSINCVSQLIVQYTGSCSILQGNLIEVTKQSIFKLNKNKYYWRRQVMSLRFKRLHYIRISFLTYLLINRIM